MNNRTIKFRMWTTKTKKMFWPHQKFGLTADEQSFFLGQYFTKNYYGDHSNYNEDIIIQQFTGLLDKNGKEIYEGDIVKRTINTGCFYGMSPVYDEFKEVKFNPYEGYGLKNPETDVPYGWLWEVVGNVFENPELLK